MKRTLSHFVNLNEWKAYREGYWEAEIAAEAKVARLTEALAPFSEIPRESVEGYDTYAPVQIKVGALTWYGLTLHDFFEAAEAMDEAQ